MTSGFSTREEEVDDEDGDVAAGVCVGRDGEVEEAAAAAAAAWCMARKGAGVVSQNLLCLLRLVTVLNACPHLWHLICIRQVACILLWRHRLENCV